MDELNPQAREMAVESMVRNLAAQADAIWPQEKALFARYQLPDEAQILDAGCGTGEIASRIGEMFSRASVLGVDISGPMLEVTRRRASAAGLSNVELLVADAGAHAFPAGELDAVVSRFGWMFFEDPPSALANARSSMLRFAA